MLAGSHFALATDICSKSPSVRCSSCSLSSFMVAENRAESTIEQQAMQFEMIAGLERALDLSYQRLARVARTEWERRFGGNDPSDACVSVRISGATADARAVPGSGFLPAPKSAGEKTNRKFSLPRFAR